MSRVTLLTRAHYKTVPWKNGRGSTSEIAIFPPDASFPHDDFLWRLSSAAVSEEGEFSEFKGYDRYLALMSGSEIELIFEKDASVHAVRSGEVFRFSGDDKVSCELPRGAVTDLNLIVKRGSVKVRFEILKLSGVSQILKVKGSTGFLISISGEVGVEVGSESSLRASVGETLLLQSAGEFELIGLGFIAFIQIE